MSQSDPTRLVLYLARDPVQSHVRLSGGRVDGRTEPTATICCPPPASLEMKTRWEFLLETGAECTSQWAHGSVSRKQHLDLPSPPSTLLKQMRYLQLHDQVQVIWAFVNVLQGDNVFMLNPETEKSTHKQKSEYSESQKLLKTDVIKAASSKTESKLLKVSDLCDSAQACPQTSFQI